MDDFDEGPAEEDYRLAVDLQSVGLESGMLGRPQLVRSVTQFCRTGETSPRGRKASVGGTVSAVVVNELYFDREKRGSVPH